MDPARNHARMPHCLQWGGMASWLGRVIERAQAEQRLAELQRAKEAAEPYHLLLLDYRMPGIDGFEVHKSLEAGCTAHLTKPIKKATLLAAVAEQIGGLAP